MIIIIKQYTYYLCIKYFHKTNNFYIICSNNLLDNIIILYFKLIKLFNNNIFTIMQNYLYKS